MARQGEWSIPTTATPVPQSNPRVTFSPKDRDSDDEEPRMSSSDEVRVLRATTNAAVVHLNGRAFPGVVIQGDSLHNLLVLIEETGSMLGSGQLDECQDLVDELRSIVAGYVGVYEATMKAERLPLPYPRTGE
jgi:hypothetical protein